ncbi:MAG: bifunctional folylpolyglutamate synthase/dihydrofolate synthase [Gemmatimonadetes bacterium]|nr:bifunctional folylpolyglutamate synthase/dihydrofolate synthase [Gemmatimonadota bacterium]
MSDSIFDQLFSLQGQSVELGLWQVTRLLDRLDHPERDWPAVHVAGTNGKGSVCAMLAAMLARAGWRTGLLTSPHLVHFSERIRVNGTPIREDEAAPILARLAAAGADPDQAASPRGDYGALAGSFFEVTTALAFEHFRHEGVEVAVLETGLGGRLDATNVCFPTVTAITSIDLDHVKTLGPDLPSIAGEKAGIIKPSVPVVVGEMAAEASQVIEAVATARGAPIRRAGEEVRVRVLSSSWEGLELAVRVGGHRERYARLPLPGRHQIRNLRVAVAAAHAFDPRPEALDDLLAGLEDTHWPGRLQRVEGSPVRVYDVAHNDAGAEALSDALDELGVPEGSVLVIGVLGDKDLAGMAKRLARHFRRAVTATPPHPVRARPAAETAEALRAAGIEASAVETVAEACEVAAEMRSGPGTVFVTGSLFTVGAAMRAFGDRVDAPKPRAGSRVE